MRFDDKIIKLCVCVDEFVYVCIMQSLNIPFKQQVIGDGYFDSNQTLLPYCK